METLKKLKNIVLHACVIYTVILTAVYTLGAFVNSSWVPTVQMVYSCLGFSLVLSALNSFLFSDKLVFALRLLIHFVASTFIFYMLFIVWGGYKSNGGSVLTALLVFVFAYVLCAAVVGIYRYLTVDKDSAKSEEYKSMFSANGNDGKSAK